MKFIKIIKHVVRRCFKFQAIDGLNELSLADPNSRFNRALSTFFARHKMKEIFNISTSLFMEHLELLPKLTFD